MSTKRHLAILGATGSIGQQTIAVAKAHPDRFVVEVLSAHSRWQELAADARALDVDSVVIADERYYSALKAELSDTDIKVWAGADSLVDVARNTSIDTVVVGVVGFAALPVVVAALETGKRVALANKESLVAGGDWLMNLAMKSQGSIIPVDSEHSAVFQCLVGEQSPVRRLILTASGGSLRDRPVSELQNVTLEEVLNHPTWSMGARITVDSATMLNKGFEVIEAARLFGLRGDQIEVAIHRQSLVHSMVEFEDRSIKAQLSEPDMRGPIQYALSFPARIELAAPKEFNPFCTLTFEAPDPAHYPCLGLAYKALASGGTMPLALNAAGEVVVEAFLAKKINFAAIYPSIDRVLQRVACEPIQSLEQLTDADAAVRRLTQETLCGLK